MLKWTMCDDTKVHSFVFVRNFDLNTNFETNTLPGIVLVLAVSGIALGCRSSVGPQGMPTTFQVRVLKKYFVVWDY
jgi:hypothetical protein